MTNPGEGATVPPAMPGPGLVTIQEFSRIVLKVGIVTAAENHPNADRLLILRVDIGEGAPRQVVAGIRNSYAAADLIGKHVVVVSNLKPAMLRGVESQGMVLAGSDGTSIILLSPERPLPAGSPIK